MPELITELDGHGLKAQAEAGLIKVMRQSTVSSFWSCQLKVRHQMDQAPGEYYAGVNRTLGTGYHAGLEELYRNGDDPLAIHTAAAYAIAKDIEQAGDRFDWSGVDGIVDQFSLGQKVRELIDIYRAHHVWPVTPLYGSEFELIGTEVKFWVPFIHGWCLHGTIDLIIRDHHTNTDILVDHKTAKRRWAKGREESHKTPQPTLYVAGWVQAYRDRLAENTKFFFDIMTLDGVFERREAPLASEHMLKVLTRAHDVCQTIENDGPWHPNTDSPLCDQRYCDFWDLCPYGRQYH